MFVNMVQNTAQTIDLYCSLLLKNKIQYAVKWQTTTQAHNIARLNQLYRQATFYSKGNLHQFLQMADVNRQPLRHTTDFSFTYISVL